jgi:hypothetical protein
VTEEVYVALRHHYTFSPRGPIEVHGKGVMNTYLLESRNGSVG